MNFTYTNLNGYLVPNLYSTDTSAFGRYGELRRRYLKNYRPVLFEQMLLEGTLNRHLSEIDTAVRKAVFDVVCVAAKENGATAELKHTDPLAWTQWMNSQKAAAEEWIFPVLLYPEEQG